MAAARRAALWSPEALDDRERIWNYYDGVAGRHTAEKILREIAEVIAPLEEHPFARTRAKRTAPRAVFVCRARGEAERSEGGEASPRF
jgi:plasmid stabilization system protein ParE